MPASLIPLKNANYVPVSMASLNRVRSFVWGMYLSRVGGLRRVEGAAQILHRDVGVSDNIASAVEPLRRTVVGRKSVREGTGLETNDLQLDIEIDARLDDIADLWVQDDGGKHLVLGRDLAHGCGVGQFDEGLARACLLREYSRIPLQEPVTI